MGLRRDEAAPQRVSDKIVQLFPPDPAVRRLTQKVESLKLDLASKYGRVARAPEAERMQYSRL